MQRPGGQGTHRKPSLASDRQIPSGQISEGNHESERLRSRSNLPAQPTYLTHDVLIVGQCQPEVCNVSIIALTGQRDSAEACVGLSRERAPGWGWG